MTIHQRHRGSSTQERGNEKNRKGKKNRREREIGRWIAKKLDEISLIISPRLATCASSASPDVESRLAISDSELLQNAQLLRRRRSLDRTSNWVPRASRVVRQAPADHTPLLEPYDDSDIEYYITERLSTGSIAADWRTVALAVLVVVVFLLTGTLFFALVEEWSALDALYFSASTITTCGLGDYAPRHTASKIFMIFYVVVALLLIGSAFGLLARATIYRHEWLVRRMQQQQYHNPTIDDGASDDSSSLTGRLDRCWSAWTGLNPLVQRSAIALLMLTAVVASTAVFFTQVEQWTLLDSVYYAVVVSSTIGFGDVVADSSAGKAFSIALMLVGSIAVITSLTSIADVFVQHAQRQLANEVLFAGLTTDSLTAMDLNNTGSVSQQEFLEFMLVHMGLVAPADIAAINRRFHELDQNHDGSLNTHDIYRRFR